jgi:mycothiol synthase
MTTMTETTWLELPGMPAIEGLRVRRFRDASDYEPMAEIMRRANLHDRVAFMPTAGNLEVEMAGEDGIVPTRDIVIAEVDGRAVATTQVWRVPRADRLVFELLGSVDPEVRGRGIGSALLTENLRRAGERAALEPAGTAMAYRAFADEGEHAHQRLLEGRGFVPIRHFFLMRRPDLATVPDLPLPDGLEVRPVTRDQHRAIFDAEAEAFQDHWGNREWTDDDFRTTHAREELDTSLWVVAWDGDQVAGVVQTWIWPEENERLGVKRGWLEHISVRRPWRRRGLARAISAMAMRRVRDAGMEDAMLGVDSENPTGALGLYEDLGFEVFSRATAYELSVRP